VQTKKQIGEGIWRNLQRRIIADFASAVGRIPDSGAQTIPESSNGRWLNTCGTVTATPTTSE
jgi:hypothetical protein